MEDVLIGEIEKNSREVVRVRFTEFKGIDLLDIRSFYEKDGERLPGKGLSLRIEKLTDLRKLLQQAEKHLKAQAEGGSQNG